MHKYKRAADHGRQLENTWAMLYDHLREIAKSKVVGDNFAAADRVCKEISKSQAKLPESLSAAGIRHIDFLMGVMLDEVRRESVDMACYRMNGCECKDVVEH